MSKLESVECPAFVPWNLERVLVEEDVLNVLHVLTSSTAKLYHVLGLRNKEAHVYIVTTYVLITYHVYDLSEFQNKRLRQLMLAITHLICIVVLVAVWDLDYL